MNKDAKQRVEELKKQHIRIGIEIAEQNRLVYADEIAAIQKAVKEKKAFIHYNQRFELMIFFPDKHCPNPSFIKGDQFTCDLYDSIDIKNEIRSKPDSELYVADIIDLHIAKAIVRLAVEECMSLIGKNPDKHLLLEERIRSIYPNFRIVSDVI